MLVLVTLVLRSRIIIRRRIRTRSSGDVSSRFIGDTIVVIIIIVGSSRIIRGIIIIIITIIVTIIIIISRII